MAIRLYNTLKRKKEIFEPIMLMGQFHTHTHTHQSVKQSKNLLDYLFCRSLLLLSNKDFYF